MLKVATFDASGARSELDLPEAVFGQRPHRPALHQAVVAELANRRAGTHSTKTRGMVRGGGRKPWRQKGTGRARHGSRRSPLWVGGGIVFGPTPRDYRQRLSHRDRRLALRSALAAQAQAGRLVVIEPPAGEPLKTGAVAAYLRAVGVQAPTVVVLGDHERGLARALRNLPRTTVLSARRLAVRHLVLPGTLAVTRSALAALQEALAS